MNEPRPESRSRWRARWDRCWSLAIAVLLLGCSSGEIEHAEHHDPPHRPERFADAVVRLGELYRERSGTADLPLLELPAVEESPIKTAADEEHEEHDESHEDETPVGPSVESRDLWVWLPTLAAETDLPEETWNAIAAISREWQSRERELAWERLADDDATRQWWRQSLTRLADDARRSLDKTNAIEAQ